MGKNNKLKRTPKVIDQDINTRTLRLYMSEIGRTTLLTHDQEIKLAKRVRSGDQAALETLVMANLRFVVMIAKQLHGYGLSLNDLINEGNLGLISAAKKFDESHGCKFISYAVWWIRQKMLKAITDQCQIVRLPNSRLKALRKINKAAIALQQERGVEPSLSDISNYLEVSVEEITQAWQQAQPVLSLDHPCGDNERTTLIEILEDKNKLFPETLIEANALSVEIQRVLKSLKPLEVDIINQYYGLNGSTPETLDQIGNKLHLTRERIRQIRNKALMRLSHPIRSKELRNFLKD